MRRIFVDVDTQNDFCSSHGALSVTSLTSPEVQNIRRLVQFAVKESTLILGSVDSHDFAAWEFYTNSNRGPKGEKPNFPPHCVKGTKGWLKVEGTLPDRYRFIPNVSMFAEDIKTRYLNPSVQAYYFEKEVYSLFANPTAEAVIHELVWKPVLSNKSQEKVQFVVFGVATDYCVKAACLGLLKEIETASDCWNANTPGTINAEVVLVTDACAPVTQAGGDAALAELTAAGVVFMTTDDFCGPSPEPASRAEREKRKKLAK